MDNDNSKQIAEHRRVLREKLAEIEHEQWIYWTKNWLENTKVMGDSGEVQFFLRVIKDHWSKSWIPYSELSEEMKDHDRKWADKVLELIK